MDILAIAYICVQIWQVILNIFLGDYKNFTNSNSVLCSLLLSYLVLFVQYYLILLLITMSVIMDGLRQLFKHIMVIWNPLFECLFQSFALLYCMFFLLFVYRCSLHSLETSHNAFTCISIQTFKLTCQEKQQQ